MGNAGVILARRGTRKTVGAAPTARGDRVLNEIVREPEHALLVKLKRARIASAHSPAIYHLLVCKSGSRYDKMMVIAPFFRTLGNVNVFKAFGSAVDPCLKATEAADIVNDILGSLLVSRGHKALCIGRMDRAIVGSEV